jgi:transcriptional regulator with XRE-family HTH domain
MDLAVASGYSLRYIGDVERGTKSATLRTMNDLATLLNIHLGDIIHEAEARLGNKEKEYRASSVIGEKSPRSRIRR